MWSLKAYIENFFSSSYFCYHRKIEEVILAVEILKNPRILNLISNIFCILAYILISTVMLLNMIKTIKIYSYLLF